MYFSTPQSFVQGLPYFICYTINLLPVCLNIISCYQQVLTTQNSILILRKHNF